jgi:hypothetical protein
MQEKITVNTESLNPSTTKGAAFITFINTLIQDLKNAVTAFNGQVDITNEVNEKHTETLEAASAALDSSDKAEQSANRVVSLELTLENYPSDLESLGESISELNNSRAETSEALNTVNEKVNSQEIIQGSNSNGYYTKFPDGRLICGHNMLINAPDNLQGSIYYSGDSVWTFPHEFALNKVDFVGGLASTSSRYEWIVGYGFTGSYGILQRKASLSHSFAQYRSVVAIGRWY